MPWPARRRGPETGQSLLVSIGEIDFYNYFQTSLFEGICRRVDASSIAVLSRLPAGFDYRILPCTKRQWALQVATGAAEIAVIGHANDFHYELKIRDMHGF